MVEDSTYIPLYLYCKYCEELSNSGSTIDHRIPQTVKSECEFTEQEELQFTPPLQLGPVGICPKGKRRKKNSLEQQLPPSQASLEGVA